MSTLTHYEKTVKYWAGDYTFPVPHVTTGGWTSADWITFIDNYGTWL